MVDDRLEWLREYDIDPDSLGPVQASNDWDICEACHGTAYDPERDAPCFACKGTGLSGPVCERCGYEAKDHRGPGSEAYDYEGVHNFTAMSPFRFPAQWWGCQDEGCEATWAGEPED